MGPAAVFAVDRKKRLSLAVGRWMDGRWWRVAAAGRVRQPAKGKQRRMAGGGEGGGHSRRRERNKQEEAAAAAASGNRGEWNGRGWRGGSGGGGGGGFGGRQQMPGGSSSNGGGASLSSAAAAAACTQHTHTRARGRGGAHHLRPWGICSIGLSALNRSNGGAAKCLRRRRGPCVAVAAARGGRAQEKNDDTIHSTRALTDPRHHPTTNHTAGHTFIHNVRPAAPLAGGREAQAQGPFVRPPVRSFASVPSLPAWMVI